MNRPCHVSHEFSGGTATSAIGIARGTGPAAEFIVADEPVFRARR